LIKRGIVNRDVSFRFFFFFFYVQRPPFLRFQSPLCVRISNWVRIFPFTQLQAGINEAFDVPYSR